MASTSSMSSVQNQSTFFEALHNLLWNDAGLDPQKALEHMTFFFAYRLIEPQVETLGLPECCKWSCMASQKNTQDLFDVMRQAVNEFRRNPQTKPYFNPPSIAKATLIQRIVEKINELDIETLRETDTLGNIFEYMLSRGMSTMSDEGQYFTNRKICNLAFDLAYEIKKTVRRDDGSLCTFADFFCGTGGFASAYVNGVKKVDPNVDWQKDKESVYCLDKNLSSVQTTLLNMLITTGVPFNINKIREHNSFQSNIVYQGLDTAGFFDTEFDFLFMNPPYGGDKTKGKEYRFKYTSGKGKDKIYHVNKEIQSIGIEDDDKVSAGVQLAMATLSKKGGVCCIVLPQGFFFGSSKKLVELRKRLIENFKVHYVVDIASGEFANTGTKTSMLVFEAGVGSTETITFCTISCDVVCSAPVDRCRQKSFSLNSGVYIELEKPRIVTQHNMVKLRDILVLKTGEYVTKTQQVLDGFPVYGGGNASYLISRHNREDKLVIAKDGVSEKCIRFVPGKFFLNHHGWTFDMINNLASESYVNQWLLQNQHVVYRLAVGTAQKGINQQSFYDIEIPIAPLDVQQRIVKPIDAWMGMAQAEEKLVDQLEKAVMCQIDVIGMNAPKVRLGDILVQQKGKKYNVSEGKDEGEYPLLRSSKDGKCKWLDTFTFTGPLIAVGTGGIANIHLKEKFNVSSHFLVFQSSKTSVIDYVYYLLLARIEEIDTLTFQGTTLRNMNHTAFMDYNISLPSLEQQQTLQPIFDEIKNKKNIVKLYKKMAQDYIDKYIPKC